MPDIGFRDASGSGEKKASAAKITLKLNQQSFKMEDLNLQV